MEVGFFFPWGRMCASLTFVLGACCTACSQHRVQGHIEGPVLMIGILNSQFRVTGLLW